MGEIFEVDEDKMEVVDVFEGAPTLYERVNIEVEVLSADGGGSVPRELTTSSETKFPPPPCPDSLQITSRYVQCHAYTVSNFKPTLLNLPHLEEYTCPWPNIEEYQRFMDEHNGTALVVHETALEEKGTDAEEAKRLASETVTKFERIKQLLTWWRHHYWPFVMGIHRSPPKGLWRGPLMFPLICAWTNGWANHRDAGDLRRYRAHYDVIVMIHPTKASMTHRLLIAMLIEAYIGIFPVTVFCFLNLSCMMWERVSNVYHIEAETK